jgi:hypothetical protein
VQSRFGRPGDEVGVYSLPGKPAPEKGNKADLAPGDKVQLPDGATILSRFPGQAERAHWRVAGAASEPAA